MKSGIVLSLGVVLICAALSSVGDAVSASTQSCSGSSAGTLLVGLNGNDGRLFVDGSTITLEDLATHALLACSYDAVTPMPATPENTKQMNVQGSGSVTFDGTGGTFGASIRADNLGTVSVIGTPGADGIQTGCYVRCGLKGEGWFIDFDDDTITFSPPAGTRAGPIFGAGGDDTILMDGHWGAAAHGGDGNDSISIASDGGTESVARFYGDAGNDTLLSQQGDDYLAGGTGNDYMSSGKGRDYFDESAPGETGANGADTIIGGPLPDVVSYANRVDSVNVSLDDNANDGEAGEGDNVGSDVETVIGGNGSDTLTGSNNEEILNGGAGDDHLYGGGGADDLSGGPGDDDLHGGPANDKLGGGEGVDQLWGDDGLDQLAGDSENDSLDGGGGNDSLNGGAGSDNMFGGAQDDTFYAIDGEADTLDGGSGLDDAYIDKGLDTTTRIEVIH